MDVNRLGSGEKIAGTSAVILLFVMFAIDWFGYGGSVETAFGTADIGGGFNLWDSLEWIRWIVLLTVIVTIAHVIMVANASDPGLPVAGTALVAGLGILCVVLILYRIIDPPGSADREPGAFIGLIAAGGIAYGGWMAMQEEGTSFGDVADGFQGGNDPPPPPPPAQ